MAIFAGLRSGELKALRWRDVDLPAGTIAVERSWDSRVGAVDPKSASARRTVPIVGALRPYLLPGSLRARGRPSRTRSSSEASRAPRSMTERSLSGHGPHGPRPGYGNSDSTRPDTPQEPVHRGRRDAQADQHVAGPLVDHDHVRHLWPPVPDANEEGVAKETPTSPRYRVTFRYQQRST